MNTSYRYVPEKLELSVFDPMYRAFAHVFENFRINDALKGKSNDDDDGNKVEDISSLKKVPKIDLDDEPDEVSINNNILSVAYDNSKIKIQNNCIISNYCLKNVVCTRIIMTDGFFHRKKMMKNLNYRNGN